MAKTMELGYWRYRGLGHSLRYILQYLELPYQEKNYHLPAGGVTKETWIQERDKIRATYPPNLPFPNIPYLLDGDLAVSESRAIMRYIARTYAPKLLGSSPLLQTRVDMLENFLYDFWYIEFAGGVVYQNTPEAVAQFKVTSPEKLGLISTYVGNNAWAAGPELTVVDFWLCEFLAHLTAYDASILKPFPNLEKLRDNFHQLPAIVKYKASPDFIQTQFYSPRANLQI